MNERATDAAAIVAIQGGATRSAAGAGSRVGALISSLIRAPKPVLVPVHPPLCPAKLLKLKERLQLDLLIVCGNLYLKQTISS